MKARLASWHALHRRIHDAYRLRHDRALNVLQPRRYTEKMQWRKMFDLDPRYAILSDKLAAREFVAARIGRDNLIPVLWHGDDPDRIPFDRLAPPYVVKSTHASAHTIFVAAGQTPDRQAIRETVRGWLAHCHGTALDEPGYVPVPHRLIVERLVLSADGAPLPEPKLMVFDGHVPVVNTAWNDQRGIRCGAFHSADWQPLPWRLGNRPMLDAPLPRPALLDEMIAAACRIAAGFEHLRVDFYDGGDRFWVGEITVYSWSGLERVLPDAADFDLGAFWKIRNPASRAVATTLTRSWQIRPSDLASAA